VSGTASGIPRATRREWIGLGVIALPCLLYSATAIPPGVPQEAASAARGTLGGALAVAERLPEQLSTAVLGPAREAFTQGMQLNAAICAVIALGTAVVAARQRSSTW